MHPMIEFPMSVTEVSGRTVVTFPTEVDVCNAPVIRDRLLRLLNNGAGPLIMDLTTTRFCDCAGMHAIVRAEHRAAGLRTRVCIVLPARGPVRRIAALTGLPRRVLVTTSLSAAHKALRQESGVSALRSAVRR
jgi:anti-anti-sigma factor